MVVRRRAIANTSVSSDAPIEAACTNLCWAHISQATRPFPTFSCFPECNASTSVGQKASKRGHQLVVGRADRGRLHESVLDTPLDGCDAPKRCVLGNMKTWGKDVWLLEGGRTRTPAYRLTRRSRPLARTCARHTIRWTFSELDTPLNRPHVLFPRLHVSQNTTLRHLMVKKQAKADTRLSSDAPIETACTNLCWTHREMAPTHRNVAFWGSWRYGKRTCGR